MHVVYLLPACEYLVFSTCAHQMRHGIQCLQTETLERKKETKKKTNTYEFIGNWPIRYLGNDTCIYKYFTVHSDNVQTIAIATKHTNSSLHSGNGQNRWQLFVEKHSNGQLLTKLLPLQHYRSRSYMLHYRSRSDMLHTKNVAEDVYLHPQLSGTTLSAKRGNALMLT